MGITVNTHKQVFYSTSDHTLLDTRLSVNPKEWRSKGYRCQSIFWRKKSKKFSDANPFIHALKGNGGYSIEEIELNKFYQEFLLIVKSICSTLDIQYIVPLPSAHCANEYIARAFCREKLGTLVRRNLLRKRTVAEVADDLESLLISKVHLPRMQKTEASRLLTELRRQSSGASFSMKKVKIDALRRKIQPFAINCSHNTNLNGRRILLIDDIWSSGASIHGAINAVTSAYSPASIEVVTLLGRL